jgi:hypothetical protein
MLNKKEEERKRTKQISLYYMFRNVHIWVTTIGCNNSRSVKKEKEMRDK